MQFQHTTELIDLRTDYSAPAFYTGDWNILSHNIKAILLWLLLLSLRIFRPHSPPLRQGIFNLLPHGMGEKFGMIPDWCTFFLVSGSCTSYIMSSLIKRYNFSTLLCYKFYFRPIVKSSRAIRFLPYSIEVGVHKALVLPDYCLNFVPSFSSEFQVI